MARRSSSKGKRRSYAASGGKGSRSGERDDKRAAGGGGKGRRRRSSKAGAGDGRSRGRRGGGKTSRRAERRAAKQDLRKRVEEKHRERKDRLAELSSLGKFYYKSLHASSLEIRADAISKAFRTTELSSVDDAEYELAAKRLGLKHILVFVVFVGRLVLNPGVALLNFVRRPERDPDVQYNFSQIVLIYLEFGLLSLIVIFTFCHSIAAVIRRRRARRRGEPAIRLLASNSLLTAYNWLQRAASFSLLKFIPSVTKVMMWIQTLSQFMRLARLKRKVMISSSGPSPRARARARNRTRRNRDAGGESSDCCTSCMGNLYFVGMILGYLLLGTLLVVLGVFAVFIKISMLSHIMERYVWEWTWQNWVLFAGFTNNVASIVDVATVEREAAFRIICSSAFAGMPKAAYLAEWSLHSLHLRLLDSLITHRGYIAGFIIFSQLHLSRIARALFQPKDAAYLAQLNDDVVISSTDDDSEYGYGYADVSDSGEYEYAYESSVLLALSS